MKKAILEIALGIVIAILATSCTQASDVPPNEVRAKELNKVIMCPICPGESIDQATNDLSIQMRGIVQQQVNDGLTDAQIKQFWIDRYGPSVILEPPREGFGLLAWLLPPLGVAAAGLALFLTLRWMKRKPEAQPDSGESSVHLTENELSSYTQRIEAALGSEGDRQPARDGDEAAYSNSQRKS